MPERFSLSQGLTLLTLFGIVFVGLRFFGAPHAVFAFMGTLGMLVCAIQMRFGARPRLASMAIGGSLLVAWEFVMHVYWQSTFILPIELRFPVSYGVAFVIGLGLGYGVGTIAAGVFLLSDWLSSSVGRPQGAHTGSWDQVVGDSDIERQP